MLQTVQLALCPFGPLSPSSSLWSPQALLGQAGFSVWHLASLVPGPQSCLAFSVSGVYSLSVLGVCHLGSGVG